MAEYVDNFSDLKELGIELDPDELDQKFEMAAAHLPKLLSNLNEETLLTLYAYYKQGKIGSCNVSKPSWFDFKGRAKWEAWKKLENMPQEKAKNLYVENIKNIDPNFDSNSDEKKTGWVCVSTLQSSNSNDAKNIVDFIKENKRDNVLELLKDTKHEQINTLDENGLALIHWAADIGSVDIISDLLTHGADINIKDSEGQTALHYSASCGHAKCIEFLLSKGAAVDVKDDEGSTPLDVANDEEIRALLM